jgi:hypothetical protein
MTDQDRGAYAPPHDAPLAFDPRRDGARRGPAPVTLVVSIFALASLIIGGVILYREGARAPGQSPQVVGSSIGDMKSQPTSSQAPSDSSAGLQIYKTEVPPPSEGTPAPKFTPGPEQPQARPIVQPPAPVATNALRPAEPAPTVVAQPAPKIAPPPPKVAPPPAKTVIAKLAPPPAPKAKIVPPPPPAPVVAATTSGGALVQIGALSSPQLAQKAWSDVARKMGGQMSGKTRKVETTSKDGKTFYRAFVGGFSSHAAAVSFCSALESKGTSCIVR